MSFLALWATMGAQWRPKATKVDQRATKRRSKLGQRAPKATKVEPKGGQRRPKLATTAFWRDLKEKGGIPMQGRERVEPSPKGCGK